MRLRTRFIISHIIPILVVIPLVGLALIFILENQILLSDLSKDLSERANVIAEAVSGQPEVIKDVEAAEAYLARIQFSTGGELLFLSANGMLLATSDQSFLGEVGQIPLIDGLDEALAGNPFVVVRYSWAEPSGIALVPISDVNRELVGVVGITEQLEVASSQFGDLRRLILAAVMISLIAGVALALILSSRLERPLVSLTQSIEEIAGGQRVEPIEETGPAEIQNLIRAVNVLAEDLHSLEDTRRRLLANIVHELGRPLGAIRSALHALRQGAAEDPAIRDELLVGIEDEVVRMQPLLDDLAQLHGQVMGSVSLNLQEINIDQWLPPIIIPWRAAAVEKGLTWESDIPDALPVLHMDPDRMSQVLGNLLSNAIKYTPEGGTVRISASASGQNLVLVVSDSGIGIRQDEKVKVFEPFYRSQESRRFPQGLGLGLTIARDLVEAHDGTLDISSQLGQGSTFTISLPLKDSPV